MEGNTKTVGDDLKQFFSDGRQLVYGRDELIVRAYDPPAGVYLVVYGYVKAYSIAKDGRENIHKILGAGDIFPIPWAFTGNQKETFYQAIDKVKVNRATRKELLDYLTKNPRALGVFIFKLIGMYEMALERIETLEQQHAAARVAAGLINLAARFGQGRPACIAVPLSHSDIAGLTNVSRETVSRVISRLERQGAVKQNDGRITILDPRPLTALLDS